MSCLEGDGILLSGTYFGDVPIIHSNSESLGKGDYNSVSKVEKADVYEYIIMTLEKAMELLPKERALRVASTTTVQKVCSVRFI